MKGASGHFRWFAAGTAGIALALFIYYALAWRGFTATVGFCAQPFCDFVDYYYPMGEAVFRTGLPVTGFLYSPFVAILLAGFPPLGPGAALVLWGILQALAVLVCLLLFRRLVPNGLAVGLLFAALLLSSYPFALNLLAGQVSTFIMAALLGMLVLRRRGRLVAGAALFAFAVTFKFYPVLFLVPFAARREIRFFLFGAAACGIFLLAVPGALLGIGDTLGFYGALLDSFRESDWVVANVHSQYFPHVVLRLADAAGYDAHGYLPLLGGLGFGIAAVNLVLIFLVGRARLRHADLWSFQLVALTIPFVLKTSWPHDFIFLPLIQAFLIRWLLAGDNATSGTESEGEPSIATAGRKRTGRGRIVVTVLLLPSIIISNIIFFNLLGHFAAYGAAAFLFWANLLLLVATYTVLVPAVRAGLQSANGC